MTDLDKRVQAEALEEQFREQFKGGRLIRHNLWDYWVALDGKTGDLGYEWSDKPHRLVFDLLHHAVAQENQIRELTAALASLPEAPAVPVGELDGPKLAVEIWQASDCGDDTGARDGSMLTLVPVDGVVRIDALALLRRIRAALVATPPSHEEGDTA